MDDAGDAFEKLRASNAEAAGRNPLPHGFRATAEGIFFFSPKPEDSPLLVCGPLRVVAATHDASGRAWGVLLEWTDPNGLRHEWAMPRAMLAGDGAEARAQLLDGGLFLASGRNARAKLVELLTRCNPAERVHVVPRIGWHAVPGGRVFVLPGETIGDAGDRRVTLQTERPEAMPPLAQSGTLGDWQQGVAAVAVGNSRLAFALCAAFAAPLLGLVNAESGGFHFRGPSSVGKSTALHAAGSVWGGGGLRGWCRSWRSTDNSLEAVAAAHCDLLLCLDEMGEAGAETVAAAAYMLANGAGKGRAGRDGSARRVAEWRCLFLSTGEEGIADRLAEARGGPKRVRAGQEVRVLDIPADTGRHGLFEALHEHARAAALADAVKGAAGRFYGAAGHSWLEHLAADPERFASGAREVQAAFVAEHVPEGADGQVRRAAARFGLVAAAGELAAAAGILPWQPREAERAAAACFMAWRDARQGGNGASEDAAAVAAVRRFIAANGDGRFQEVGGDDTANSRPIYQRAGWKKRDGDGWLYLIQPDVWRGEVVAGLDPKAAAAAVHRAGYLVPQNAGRLQKSERVGASEPVRCYAVRDTILSGEVAE
jgi:putative DNA primase/helicase